MPIGVQNFQPLNQNQTNPIMGGLSAALAARLQSLQGRTAKAQLPYVGPQSQANLQRTQLGNQGMEAQLPYLGPQAAADLQKAQQFNQYYGPDMQSQINQRQAGTSNMQQHTLEQKILNSLLPESERARIDAMNARAQNAGMGGFPGVGQAELNGFQKQLMMDNPGLNSQEINQMAGKYLLGQTDTLPPLSGIAQSTLAQIQKRNSNATLQNQAANMDVLAHDLNGIDIKPLEAFAGPSGRGEVAKYTAMMTAGKNVPQNFRDYLSFKKVVQPFAMDAMRKGFGTTVVPEYVTLTLGAASNPASTWWEDPQQVKENWTRTTNWINNNAKALKKKSTQGVGVSLDDYNNSAYGAGSPPSASPSGAMSSSDPLGWL